MLLHKTLHLSHSIGECKTRLLSLQSHGRPFPMETTVTMTSSKTVDLSFRGPLGFRARTVVFPVQSESPNEWAFESAGGSIDLMGSVEFKEIDAQSTEIHMVAHCKIRNAFYSWLNRRKNFMDAFVTSELRSVQAHFNGSAAPAGHPDATPPALETAVA
ncbi:MAG TPA: hypothetical protein VGG94_01720 [Chthoniobacterales bacterium]|jgi:hypothetical protein